MFTVFDLNILEASLAQPARSASLQNISRFLLPLTAKRYSGGLHGRFR